MTRVGPPPGLLDKIAEAIHDSACGQHDCDLCIRYPEAEDAARAAWDAVADQLQLTEEAQTRCTGCGSSRPGYTDWLLSHAFHDTQPTEYVHEGRLVSKWERGGE